MNNRYVLAVVGFFSLYFAAFEKIHFYPMIFVFPMVFNQLSLRCEKRKQAMGFGFLTSLLLAISTFYWITLALHDFAHLSWSLSSFLFVLLCAVGGLNLPVFLLLASAIHRNIPWQKLSTLRTGIWLTLGLPSLFTLTEFLVPRLFPWYLGNGIHQQLWFISIIEITGVGFLSFVIYSVGSFLGLYLFRPEGIRRSLWMASIPVSLVVVCLGFSLLRGEAKEKAARILHVALIQANVQSQDKLVSEKGTRSVTRAILNRFEQLTQTALAHSPVPDLVLWPETAMPFEIKAGNEFSDELMGKVKEWKVPLITGGYTGSPRNFERGYNSAFLIEPLSDGSIHVDTYHKNHLFMFGEYLPFRDWIPGLYDWFPKAPDFEAGTELKPLTLNDGTRIGVTLCYEDILPGFFRKIANLGVDFTINLSNDSWFGPTSEPYAHASLAAFRSVESRLAFLRVANSGTSFSEDRWGHLSALSPLFVPHVAYADVTLASSPQRTFYVRYGNWFMVLCGLLLILGIGSVGYSGHWRRNRIPGAGS